MYLHIGGDTVIKSQDVVGIFDLDNSTQSKITRDYLRAAEEKGEVYPATEDLPKSFIVCGNKEQRGIFLSQLAPATLLKRSESFPGRLE